MTGKSLSSATWMLIPGPPSALQSSCASQRVQNLDRQLNALPRDTLAGGTVRQEMNGNFFDALERKSIAHSNRSQSSSRQEFQMALFDRCRCRWIDSDQEWSLSIAWTVLGAAKRSNSE